jgi:MFS family permease
VAMTETTAQRHRPAATNRPRTARVAVALTFATSGLLFGAWAPRIAQVKAHLGLSSAALGLDLLMSAIGALIALRFVGRWCATYGTGRVAQLATVACCATAWLTGVASNLAELGLALLIWGATIGAMDVSMNAQGVTVEARYHRPVMSGFHAAWSIGTFTGSLLGELAASQHLPLWAQQAGLGAVLCAACVVASRAFLADPAHTAAVLAPRRRLRFRRPPTRLLLLGLAGLFALVSEGTAGDWSAVLLREHLHVPLSRVGLAFAGFSIAMTGGRLIGDRLVHRFGARGCVATLSVIGASGLAIGLDVNTLPSVVAGFVFLGIGLSIMVPVVFSAAADGGPSGPAIATVASLSYTGFLIGPTFVGLIAQGVGVDFAMKLLPLVALAGGLLGVVAIGRTGHWQAGGTGRVGGTGGTDG